MRQALHILRKDVRHLWIEMAVVLVCTILLVFTDTSESYWLAKSPLPHNVASMLVTYLLPVSWWVLIVRAIHAEALVGDREFWPTRPYAWPSLLGAKALLVALFINLPMLAGQMVILRANGFPLAGEAAGLLWNQALITVVFLLPVAVAAALTTGMVQFLLVGLVAFVSLLLLSMRFLLFASAIVGGGWPAMEWIHVYYSLLVIALAGVAMLFWQYAQRRTLAGRLAAGAVVLVLAMGAPVSWDTAFAIQSHFGSRAIDPSAIRAGFYQDFQWMTRALIEREHRVSLHIPLELAGVPSGLTAKPEAAAFTIEGPAGAIWRADEEPYGHVTSTGQMTALRTTVDEAFYQRVKDQPVSLRGTVYLTLYGNRQVTQVPFTGSRMDVPGLGRCSATGGSGAPYFLVCNAAMRPPADLVSVRFEQAARDADSYGPIRRVSYSPFPAVLSLNPLTPHISYSTYKGQLESATVSALDPVAFVRAPIAIDGLRLGGYEARLK
ncbi:MAG TPA: hypothetical protein VGS58_06895 [Candidatus Sulfopaludibacter sp.]|nr:hypothetical protein [Candidatus Sulfopaludibacter sp.]